MIVYPHIKSKMSKHKIALRKEMKMLEERGVVCLPLRSGFKYPVIDDWQIQTETHWSSLKDNTKGYGILCGAVSGVTCVDIDDMKLWKEIEGTFGKNFEFDETPTVESPSGGLHYYFKYDEEIKTTTNAINIRGADGYKVKSNVDIRNDVSQVVAPPSKYCANKPEKKKFNDIPYKWVLSFEECEPIECPAWLKDLVTKKKAISIDEAGLMTLIDGSTSIPERPKVPKLAARDDNLDNEVKVPVIPVAEAKVEIDGINWAGIGDDGSYEHESEKKTLSLDQITQIVQNLNHSRFGDYTTWCNLLWAVARWQDANDANEDDVVDMLDAYCQQCDNYGNKSDVQKKYNEAFKRAGQQSKVTVGTLIHWLKEDNFAVYCNVLGFAKVNQVKELAAFDRNDTYLWVDFLEQLIGKVWEDRAALDEFVSKNIHRVLAEVQLEGGFYLKKDNCDKHLFNYVETIKGALNKTIKYAAEKEDKRRKDKKKTKYVENIKLAEYLNETNVLPLYSDVGCYPDPNYKACPPKTYNVWEGYVAKKVDEVDKELIKDLRYILKELWAGGDKKLYKYLLAWFRFVVANPAEMTRVALYLCSEPGAGKSSFINFFIKYVLGQGLSHTYTGGIQDVVEKHDTNKRGKKMIYISEMANDKDQFINNFDKIKSLITDPWITENPKGKTIIQIDNIANVIMSTNHKNAIYIPSDSDRRYTCIEVSNAKTGEAHAKWWNEVNARIMNQEVGNHFYSWLLSLDPKKLPNPHVVFKTKLRNEIIELSRDNVLAFADWFKHEEYNGDGAQNRSVIKARDLFKSYCEWCKEAGERPKSERVFGMMIIQKFTREKRDDANYYNIE